jgi:hypothetical protein
MADDYSELLEALDAYAAGRLRPISALNCEQADTAIRALVAENERLERERRDVSQLLIVRTLEIAKFQQALRDIASCESLYPGDVVSIACTALGETK